MIACLLFLVVPFLAEPSNASPRLALHVTPAIASAPATLLVRASVAPNAGNRAIEIVADSESYYRSSVRQLDGDRAPRTALLELYDLPGGDYEVTAQLTNANGQRIVARCHVIVVGSLAGR